MNWKNVAQLASCISRGTLHTLLLKRRGPGPRAIVIIIISNRRISTDKQPQLSRALSSSFECPLSAGLQFILLQIYRTSGDEPTPHRFFSPTCPAPKS